VGALLYILCTYPTQFDTYFTFQSISSAFLAGLLTLYLRQG
jgi:hypothetical protein